MQYVSSVDVTFNEITLTEIFEEGWVYDTLWVDEGCFVDGTGFPRCKIEGKNKFLIKTDSYKRLLNTVVKYYCV